MIVFKVSAILLFATILDLKQIDVLRVINISILRVINTLILRYIICYKWLYKVNVAKYK